MTPKEAAKLLGIGKPILAHDDLIKKINYEPTTGFFAWFKATRGRKSAIGVGSVDTGGYLRISVNGKRYLAHRLAWFYTHGVWPDQEIDHINRDRLDNRLCNLREATVSQNRQNRPKMSRNTSGIKGVKYIAVTGKWVANIDCNGKKQWLGTYSTAEAAGIAYSLASKAQHGIFGSTS